jgi:hypothetical protein
VMSRGLCLCVPCMGNTFLCLMISGSGEESN